MSLPLALTIAYLAVNLPLMLWVELEKAGGRPAPRMGTLSSLLRYGPPLVGAAYLVTISGDWPFVLFVIAFFAGAFWLLAGLLNYPTRPPKRER